MIAAADRYIAGGWWRVEQVGSQRRYLRPWPVDGGYREVPVDQVPRCVRDELDISLGISGMDRRAS